MIKNLLTSSDRLLHLETKFTLILLYPRVWTSQLRRSTLKWQTTQISHPLHHVFQMKVPDIMYLPINIRTKGTTLKV